MNRGRLMAMFALALAGCAFSGSDGEGEGTGSGDGSGSGSGSGTGSGSGSNMVEPPRCKFTYVDVCAFKEAVGPALNYTADTTINTSNNCPHVVTQTGGPELCVFHSASLTIAAEATVRAIGTRPLVFVTTGNISIAGRLDASSDRSNAPLGPAELLGAGAASGTCDAFADTPDAGNGGGGGGAGASFSGKGGDGGKGDTRGGGGSGNDGGKPPEATATVAFLRGGCRGQNGALGGGGSTAGVGGPPGGSVYLAAAGEITISGRVLANGGGGRGSSPNAGGGGGGSGGVIFLESKLTHRPGMLVANGGGGGEAGFTITGGPFAGQYPGSSGSDGSSGGDAANGGQSLGRQGGTAGGRSSGGAQRNGTKGGDNADNGGSGGGGAAGFIRVVGPSDGAGTVSPPITP